MTDIKVSGMSPDAAPTTDDYLMVIDNTTTSNKRVTLADLITLVGANLANSIIDSTNIDWTTAGAVWWQELGRATLSVAGDNLSVSIASKKFIKIIAHGMATGGTIDMALRFNSDTGNNYAHRLSTDNAADSTSVSRANIGSITPVTTAVDQTLEAYIINISNKEKLVFGQGMSANTAGAANAPQRRDIVGKWANTSGAISTILIYNGGGSGDLAIGSELIVLGHD